MSEPTLLAPLAKALHDPYRCTGQCETRAAAILAALRADPEAYKALVRFAQEWLDDDETDSLDRLLGPKP